MALSTCPNDGVRSLQGNNSAYWVWIWRNMGFWWWAALDYPHTTLADIWQAKVQQK